MFVRKASVSLLSFGLMCALGLAHCGGGGGGGGSNGSGSGSTSGGSGSTSGSTGGSGSTSGSSGSTSSTTTTTTNGTSGTTGASCVEEDKTWGTDLPYSNDKPFSDQDCTTDTAKFCPTGDCVEWEDNSGKHGKCFVYCGDLVAMPGLGDACTSFATCRHWKGANVCLPNSLNLCGQSSSSSTSGSSGSTSGGSGSTSGSSCKHEGAVCSDDKECCSNWCSADNTCN